MITAFIIEALLFWMNDAEVTFDWQQLNVGLVVIIPKIDLNVL